MTSLMSIFDPSMCYYHLGWLAAAASIFFLKGVFWKVSSSVMMIMNTLISFLLDLFKSQKVLFLALFIFILNTNLLGLLPWVFSPTSHLSFNLTLSLTLWLGAMIWYFNNNLLQFMSHLTPLGCPLVLAPLLVVIELVSSLIRPLTLSLRLMANVMAGHMILTLISKGVFSLSVVVSIPLFSILIGFLLFEFGVALVQSYVFSNLMSLYWEETSH